MTRSETAAPVEVHLLPATPYFFRTSDGRTFPRAMSDAFGELRWRLRYGTLEARERDRYVAASALDLLVELVDATRERREEIVRLIRRAEEKP